MFAISIAMIFMFSTGTSDDAKAINVGGTCMRIHIVQTTCGTVAFLAPCVMSNSSLVPFVASLEAACD